MLHATFTKIELVSKKAFNSDLDSVFAAGAQYEPNIDSSPWLARTAVPAKSNPQRGASGESATTITARRPNKSFTSDLDAFFAESSFDRPRPTIRVEETSTRLRERPRRSLLPLAGLDGLIRDTTGGKAIEQYERREAEAIAPAAPKRVTFTYDRDRFSQLKDIARQEGNYLKDIISGLLNEYLAKHGGSTVRARCS